MANNGEKNTNGSQFCIATIPCLHLSDTNVVFGKVLAGMGVVDEIQKYGQGDDSAPVVDCVIEDCGEIEYKHDWGLCCDDGTPDTLPEWPEDCDNIYNKLTIDEAIESILNIKIGGNRYYTKLHYKTAIRKYNKCLRHVDYVITQMRTINSFPISDASMQTLIQCRLQCHLNLAACYLHIEKYDNCIIHCNHVLLQDSTNEKALYRRGRARYALLDFENSLEDLNMAASVEPHSIVIKKLLNTVTDASKTYNATQRKRLSNFFRP